MAKRLRGVSAEAFRLREAGPPFCISTSEGASDIGCALGFFLGRNGSYFFFGSLPLSMANVETMTIFSSTLLGFETITPYSPVGRFSKVSR